MWMKENTSINIISEVLITECWIIYVYDEVDHNTINIYDQFLKCTKQANFVANIVLTIKSWQMCNLQLETTL